MPVSITNTSQKEKLKMWSVCIQYVTYVYMHTSSHTHQTQINQNCLKSRCQFVDRCSDLVQGVICATAHLLTLKKTQTKYEVIHMLIGKRSDNTRKSCYTPKGLLEAVQGGEMAAPDYYTDLCSSPYILVAANVWSPDVIAYILGSERVNGMETKEFSVIPVMWFKICLMQSAIGSKYSVKLINCREHLKLNTFQVCSVY